MKKIILLLLVFTLLLNGCANQSTVPSETEPTESTAPSETARDTRENYVIENGVLLSYVGCGKSRHSHK